MRSLASRQLRTIGAEGQVCVVQPSPIVNLESGQVLSGTLRLVKKIAEGGMGSVWLAEHLVLGTEVAVKFMSRQWALVPGSATRFLREARMTAKLHGPNVVRVLDCRLTEGDEPYLVLELLRGDNLEQRVSRQGPLPLAAVVSIVAQTSEALSCAHAEGIVHRDIKPENVFLEGTPPRVKLLDFGVAKPTNGADCLDVDRLPAGTVQYMSPEHMFDPETTDERSDLFSLAAVAYFALTGRAPFDAESLEALYFAIDGGVFTAPSVTRQDLPEAVDRWFSKALAHRPEDRFATARELADAFATAAREGSRGEAREEPAGNGGELVGLEPRAPRDVTRGVPGRTPLRHTRGAVTAALAITTTASLLAWSCRPRLTTAEEASVDEVAPIEVAPQADRARSTGDRRARRSDALPSQPRQPTIR